MLGKVISSIRRKSCQKKRTKKKTEMKAFREVWEEVKKKEKAIPDLKSGVQG